MQKTFDKTLNIKSVLVWYITVLLISILGTYLAYNEPIGTYAWQNWSSAGAKAWQKDSIRATFIMFLSLFALFNLNVLSSWGSRPQDCYPLFKLSVYEKLIVIFLGVTLLIVQFTYLRSDFISNLDAMGEYPSMENNPEKYSFREITLPYFPYSMYTLGLYIGIMTPIIIVAARRFFYDFKILVNNRKKIKLLLTVDDNSMKSFNFYLFKQFELAFQNYVIYLKNFSERFLPLILSVAVFLIIEHVSGSRDTATNSAVEITKVFAWIFLVPVMIIFLSSVAIGYQSTVKGVENKFQSLVETIGSSNEMKDLMEEILKFREKLIWNYSPLSFMLSTVKSASIAIPLLLTLIFYTIQQISKGHNWLEILFPEEIVSFFQNLY